jgi:hypothetical protein
MTTRNRVHSERVVLVFTVHFGVFTTPPPPSTLLCDADESILVFSCVCVLPTSRVTCVAICLHREALSGFADCVLIMQTSLLFLNLLVVFSDKTTNATK